MGKNMVYPLEGLIYPPGIFGCCPYSSEEYLGMPYIFSDPQGCTQSLPGLLIDSHIQWFVEVLMTIKITKCTKS